MKKVLVVDDNEDIRNMLTEALQLLGFHVVRAANGKEAVEIWKTDKFDLVLTDLEMPKMNGIQLIYAIRELNPDQLIVMITGGFTKELEARAKQMLGECYLAKPFDLNKLEKKLISLGVLDGPKLPIYRK